MGRTAVVTDADLQRARDDRDYRHRLVQDHLELLLAALNKLRNTGGEQADARQIREGVALAVRLADILHKIAETDEQ